MANITVEMENEHEYLEFLLEFENFNNFLKPIFDKHRIFCENECKKHLKNHDDRLAGEWLARSEEPYKLINLMKQRFSELNKKFNREGGT